jgi:hypothetical protein
LQRDKETFVRAVKANVPSIAAACYKHLIGITTKTSENETSRKNFYD